MEFETLLEQHVEAVDHGDFFEFGLEDEILVLEQFGGNVCDHVEE